MYSVHDTPKGWVAPFGHPGIKACSRLLRDFRSVPRPSSPPGAKASTECPSLAPSTHTQNQPSRGRVPSVLLAARPNLGSIRRVEQILNTYTHTYTPLNPATRPRSAEPSPCGGQSSTGQTNHADRITDPSPPQPARSRSEDPPRTEEAPELSCAPRSAPEPDSHVTKTKTPGICRPRPAQRQ